METFQVIQVQAHRSLTFRIGDGELGRLVKGAQSTMEDVKSEFVPEEIDEARRTVEDLKPELGSGTERDGRDRKT